MKGYKLLREIANGNIKEGTQFRNLSQNPMYDNRDVYTYKNNNFTGRHGGMNIIEILNDDFEIIEEQQDIDIQEIEQINLSSTPTKYEVILNKLVQAVKQLDNKMKEINNK